jgi:hypothetical protein
MTPAQEFDVDERPAPPLGSVDERLTFLERRSRTYLHDVAEATAQTAFWRRLASVAFALLLAAVAFHEYRMSRLRDPLLIYFDGTAASAAPTTAVLHGAALRFSKLFLAQNSATVRADLAEARRMMPPRLAAQFDRLQLTYAKEKGRSIADDVEGQRVATSFLDMKGVRGDDDGEGAERRYHVTLWGRRATYQDGRGLVDERLVCYDVALIPNPPTPENPLGLVVDDARALPTTPDGEQTNNPVTVSGHQEEP